MSTLYRVDVNTSFSTTPVGMNSLRYLGGSWIQACLAYDATLPGLDAWGRYNSAYGVTLAVWDESKREYIIKKAKGF
jgi:hypothetical protein